MQSGVPQDQEPGLLTDRVPGGQARRHSRERDTLLELLLVDEKVGRFVTSIEI